MLLLDLNKNVLCLSFFLRKKSYLNITSLIMANHINSEVNSCTMIDENQCKTALHDLQTDDLSTEDILRIFDDFLLEFARLKQNSVATMAMLLDTVEEITVAVYQIKPYKLLSPQILQHGLMKFLHQILIDIVNKWRADNARLNIQESDIFLRIVLIFLHAAEQTTDQSAETNRKRIRDFLATKRFLILVSEQIYDNIINKEGLNDDPNICTLGLLTIRILEGAPFFYERKRTIRLYDDRK